MADASVCETTPAEHFSFAHLFTSIPMEKVKAALCDADANDERERSLPAKYMVYFVLALSLYSDKPATEVFRQLVETLKSACGPLTKLKVPAKSSITYARKKLGAKTFRELFKRVVSPIAIPGRTIGAFFKGWRLVAIDGVQFNIPDTIDNDEDFGRSKTKSSEAAFPAIRVVGLIEIGTRVLFDYEIGPSGGAKEESENRLAKALLPRLLPGMLCIADRLYSNHGLWSLAKQTNARLLWRVKADVRLEPIEVLSDGSFTARLYAGDRRTSTTFDLVRVIEYQVGSEKYRLITNIMSPSEATNVELANLYHERWEHEIANKEQKHELNAYLDTLRSKTPDLAEQELIGMFILHFAVRSVMHEAALMIGEDVDRLSFKHTISVIERRAPQVGAFPP